MNDILMPSLEHRALIKTVITLFNQDDVRTLIAWFGIRMSSNLFVRIEGKVQELPLPESMKKKLFAFIKPIGIEIDEWKAHLKEILSDVETFGSVIRTKTLMMHQLEYSEDVRYTSLVRKNFQKLCWTPQGTVDRRKTAEGLIRDENLDITEGYKLACINCLEDDILMLWNKMPEDCKTYFYNEEDPRHVKQHPLVVLWTYDIKGEVTRMHRIAEEKWHGCTPYQYAFHCAVLSGNKPATQHFLHKLTSEEREVSLVKSVYPNKGTLCYLLSQMNEVQQEGMLIKHSYTMLSCLINWPLQGLFIEMAKHVWDSLESSSYSFLLGEIIRKAKDDYKDYNYQKLFTEFWQLSPITHKERVIRCSIGYLLSGLVDIKDKENFKIILDNATTLDRERIIFSSLSICESLLFGDEMDLLEFFVQECIPSKKRMIKFKEEFEMYLICYHSKKDQERQKDLLEKFSQLLNDIIQNNKRKYLFVEEERNSGPAKRLCSLTSE